MTRNAVTKGSSSVRGKEPAVARNAVTEGSGIVSEGSSDKVFNDKILRWVPVTMYVHALCCNTGSVRGGSGHATMKPSQSGR